MLSLEMMFLHFGEQYWGGTHCDAVVDFICHVVCHQLDVLLSNVLHRTDYVWLGSIRPRCASALGNSTHLQGNSFARETTGRKKVLPPSPP